MARRTAKKSSPKPRKVASAQTFETAPVPASSSSLSGGSFVKWFVIAVVVVLVLDMGHFFKGGISLGKKFYPLKKIAQFSGTDSTGKAMAAFDIKAIGPEELAVADVAGNQVLVFDLHGKLLRKWGKPGDKGPYEYHEPSAISTDKQGRLYVLDTWNGFIKCYDLGGKFVQQVDLHSVGGFYGPRQMVWGGNGFLMPSGNQLVRLSLAGQLISSWGGAGT